MRDVRLTDLQGRIIHRGAVNGNNRYTMDVGGLENGDYLIELRNMQGARLRTERIVVLH